MFYDIILIFFFFKQKTAYELRISDWSSDVCSSDLLVDPLFGGGEIAQCLADSGAGFGDEHLGAVLAITRGEDRGGRAGVILLPRAAFGAVAGQAVEAGGDVGRVDRYLARLATRRSFLPFGEAREEPALICIGAGDRKSVGEGKGRCERVES